MTIKTLGMMRIVSTILRLSVVVVLIGITNIGALADGGQVPYPPGGSTVTAEQ